MYLDSLGWIYYKSGKYNEALVEIERAAATSVEDPTIYDHMGDILIKLGQKEKGISAWEKALEMKVENQKQIREKIKKAREE